MVVEVVLGQVRERGGVEDHAAHALLMQGVGHLPMFEQPEKSALDYLAFRARLQEARAP